MNNYFNLKRFGKYFLYDLKNGWNNFGINLIVLGMMPLLIYLICSTFRLIFEGSFHCNISDVQSAIVIICYVTVMIAYPTKVYGRYTDKKPGANWITLPTSSFEKFLSLLLILILVLPVILTLLMMLSNGILALIYGDSSKNLIPLIMSGARKISVAIPKFNWIISNWIDNILLFTLGALVFKKAKVVKTILVTFLIVMVIAVIIGTAFDVWSFNFDMDARSANIILNIIVIGQFLLLGGGIYWRISNIKY